MIHLATVFKVCYTFRKYRWRCWGDIPAYIHTFRFRLPVSSTGPSDETDRRQCSPFSAWKGRSQDPSRRLPVSLQLFLLQYKSGLSEHIRRQRHFQASPRCPNRLLPCQTSAFRLHMRAGGSKPPHPCPSAAPEVRRSRSGEHRFPFFPM